VDNFWWCFVEPEDQVISLNICTAITASQHGYSPDQAIQQYGSFAERSRRAMLQEKPPDAGPTSGGGRAGRADSFRGRNRLRREHKRPGSAIRTVADLMRNWATYNHPETNAVQEATLDAPENSTLADSVVLHNKVMSGLSALQRLEKELELTFRAAQEARREGPVEWDDDSSHTLTARPAVNEGEEVALSVELQGAVRTSYGKAHSVVLRVPWAFELQPGRPAMFWRCPLKHEDDADEGISDIKSTSDLSRYSDSICKVMLVMHASTRNTIRVPIPETCACWNSLL